MNFSVPCNSGIDFVFLTPGLSDTLTCFLHLHCLADLSALGLWGGSSCPCWGHWVGEQLMEGGEAVPAASEVGQEHPLVSAAS